MPNIRTPFGVIDLVARIAHGPVDVFKTLYSASRRNSKAGRDLSDRISGYPIGQGRGFDAARWIS